jgi:signal transduction histidine kinase
VRVQPVDLRETLAALTRDLAGLDVRLELPDDLSAMDPARADALLRCVQELITNTLRHAAARRLVIAVTQSPDGAVAFSAADDGKGGPFVEGQGLAGMRERFEALGGSLSFASAVGHGFRVAGALPPAGAFP